MNVETLCDLVECVRDLALEGGDRDAAAELDALRDGLVPFAEQVINATSRKRIRASFGNEDLTMRFGRALAFLRIFQRGSEKIGRAQDVKALQGIVADLEKQPSAPARRRRGGETPANDQIDVATAIGQLREAGNERAQFEPIFARLESLSHRELSRIAGEYAGVEGSKTKDAALAAIRGRFEAKVQRQRKSNDIDRLSTRRRKS